jgi:hypothetical protein
MKSFSAKNCYQACAAGGGNNSRRARAVYFGLARDYELDSNFSLKNSSLL